MALHYICTVKVLSKEQIFTILFLLICIDDCSWQVSWINSEVLSHSFSQCILNLEKILERNLVELENIIIWKTLEQNSWFFSFSVFELVLVTACGRADARNFEFNEIRVLNIGSTTSYLRLKSNNPNLKCSYLSVFWFILVTSFCKDDASTVEHNAADYFKKCQV